jgi:hypothetical protein
MRQHHGIKVGDLVKFKHDMFENLGTVHLVTEVLVSDVKVACASNDVAVNIRLHGNSGITHRAHNFIVISKGRK